MQTVQPPAPTWPRSLLALLTIWLAAANTVGASGTFYGMPAPVIGGTNALLTTLTLLALYFNRPLRLWALTVSLRVLVLYHVVRFVGIGFLVLYEQGTIPGEFAITAGWGDIAVAVTAIVVALIALPANTRSRWWILLVWNVFGLADILLVLFTGIRLGFADMAEMIWITAYPWSLLPTFIVPLVLVTHVLIFVRLHRLRHVLFAPADED